LFSAMTVFALLWMYFRRRRPFEVRPVTLIAGFFYLALSIVVLYFGFKQSPTLNLWVGTCILASLIGFFITRRKTQSNDKSIPISEEVSGEDIA
jgi:hypothetical protein